MASVTFAELRSELTTHPERSREAAEEKHERAQLSHGSQQRGPERAVLILSHHCAEGPRMPVLSISAVSYFLFFYRDQGGELHF